MTDQTREDITMKKTIAFLIALIMIISAAAAYAQGEPPAGGPGGTPPGGFMGTPPDGTPPDGPGGGDPPDGMGGGPGGTPPGGGASSFEYAAAAEITQAASVSGVSYASETADESALMVNTAENVHPAYPVGPACHQRR